MPNATRHFAFLVLAVALAAAAGPARAESSDSHDENRPGWDWSAPPWLEQGQPGKEWLGLNADRLRQDYHELRDKAEQAVILGGAVVYQYRHTIAGLSLGCLAGAAAGAATGVAAGAATGGAALPSTAPAAALGCGLGAMAGAQIGQKLDDPFPRRETLLTDRL
ncbi:hypothetical protein [Azospirillum sp. SYSU D00513]|uniref:hypothetical protein n=1 Tax=Azospirillum sp. SYSU D00513 TaxID=2812561 RepID=UPI001A975BBE|nr:hypothetical protein [Azospirillum sp. SYSU D00513]